MASVNNSGTCGVLVGGDMNVENLVNVVQAPVPVASAASARKMPFRFGIPVGNVNYRGRQATFDKINNHFGNLTSFRSVTQKVFKRMLSIFSSQPVQPTSCWNQMIAIVGLGGIGKTELACQFANKFSSTYPNAAWINAETEQSALESFRGLAKVLGIVYEDKSHTKLDVVKEVYRHIHAKFHEKVLFIFDNAMQLNSSEENFGIFNYLPTEDLGNHRFPFVIITTQSPDWHKGITTFKLDELSEPESIEFFRSAFKVQSSECDEAFKKLYSHLQGYPLAMNLSTSMIDYDPGNDTLNWLRDRIKEYLEKFDEEDSSILTEKISENSTSRYNKTLATVWQLSFQKVQAAPNALKLLQALSFFDVPVSVADLRRVLVECHFCPGTPDWMTFQCLRESIRLLQGLHIVDCIFVNVDYSDGLKPLRGNEQCHFKDLPLELQEDAKNAKAFWCDMRVHRLIQLVVRLQMECGPVLEDILRFLALWSDFLYVRELNVKAVEDACKRANLTTRALAFVGLRALKYSPAAKRVVQITSRPLEDPAAMIWRVHSLLNKDNKTLNSEAIDVLRGFVRLSTVEKNLVDKRFFAEIALEMFYCNRLFPYVREDGTSAPGIFLPSLRGIADIACELLSTGCSFNEVCSRPLFCQSVQRSNTAMKTLDLGDEIIEHLNAAQLPNEVAKVVEDYREFVYRTDNWIQFQEEVSRIFWSTDSRKKIESDVKSCGTDQVGLKQVFSSILYKIWSASFNKNFSELARLKNAFREMDCFIYKFLMLARDLVILIPLMEAYIDILTHPQKGLLENWQIDQGRTIDALGWVCSTWMYFSIQEDLISSDILFRHLARDSILAEIKKIPVDSIRYAVQSMNAWTFLAARHAKTYQQFMENYSESSVEEIRTLVTICREIQRELPRSHKQLALPDRETPHKLAVSESRHPRIMCDDCGEKNLKGCRFKCSTCDDYDLCQSCYSERQTHVENLHVFLVLPSMNATHACSKNDMRRRINFDMLSSNKSKFLKECISSEVACYECSEAITGIRFICTECNDYNLCKGCYIGRNVHSHHLLVSTQSPLVDVLSWASAMFQAMRISKTMKRWDLKL